MDVKVGADVSVGKRSGKAVADEDGEGEGIAAAVGIDSTVSVAMGKDVVVTGTGLFVAIGSFTVRQLTHNVLTKKRTNILEKGVFFLFMMSFLGK